MFRYILRRIGTMMPLLAIVTGFVFLLGQYGAGDMAMAITLQINNNVFDPKIYESLRHELGTDQPAMVRFISFLGGALHWDFGKSYVLQGTPEIGGMMLTALPISAQLGLAAIIIVIVVGVPLGILAAIGHNTVLDYVVVMPVTVLSSVPTFVLVPVSMFLFVVQFKLVPNVGIGWRGLFHAETLLAAACLAVGPMLGVVRYTRAQVLEVLSQDYVRAARVRGLPEVRVIAAHVVKNALTPVVTVLGMSMAFLVSGSIFVEAPFGFRGFGWLAVRAFQGGDIQTVAACTLISATIVMLANLLVDLLYGMLDPRVRIGR